MSSTPAAAIGGAAGGALALIALLFLVLWFCIFRHKNASETTGSSDPSSQERRNVAMELSMRESKRFEMEELAQAAKNFTSKSLIGVGKFGEVYKGLLQDGVLVAIKKRTGLPTQEFVNEVRYLSSIKHRNLVTLLGYCQESNTQFLVYEYVPNGSVSNHLYGSGPSRLEFRNRLAISIGAAKGLAHLHSLSPRLIHKDFKTANVLVDENFIAKVADAGVRNFLGREDAGTSSHVVADHVFLSPEVQEFKRFSDKSDVYAFGVFLLELVSGREASEPSPSSSTQTLVEWMQSITDYTEIPAMIDERLGGTYTAEGVEEVITLILICLDVSSEKRPTMSYVVTELERILDKEVSLTTVMGEDTDKAFDFRTMATKLFSPPLSCPWVTSRDVEIKRVLPRRRRECETKQNRVSAVTAMVVEPLSAVSSSAIQIHQWWEQSPSSLLLMAETGGGYSLASYYTSLGLFVISVPGLWSLIKRSVKSKIVRKTFVVSEGIKKEPKQVAGEILSFFTRKNFNVTDRGETITFEGTMVPSRGQAALLTFCTCISLASVGLVLTITVPDFGNNWFFITILSPLAGAYYWKKASRKEEIKVKMMVGRKGKLDEIVVQGDDVQVEEMRKELQLSEKGMVYVKGLFERS